MEYIPQLDEITTGGMRIEDGCAYPSDQPGLGIAWDFDAITASAVEGMSATITR